MNEKNIKIWDERKKNLIKIIHIIENANLYCIINYKNLDIFLDTNFFFVGGVEGLGII